MRLQTKCSKCNKQLKLQDFQSLKYKKETEVFVFKCKCGEKNESSYNIFENEHISIYFLESIRNNTEKLKLLPSKLKDKIQKHFDECSHCSQLYNELYLNEVNENIHFKESCFLFFIQNAVNLDIKFDGEVEITGNDIKIKSCNFDDLNYKFDDNDEFFRDEQRVCYFLKNNYSIIGMIGFRFDDEEIFLEAIYFRSELDLNEEKKFKKQIQNKTMKLSSICNLLNKSDFS